MNGTVLIKLKTFSLWSRNRIIIVINSVCKNQKANLYFISNTSKTCTDPKTKFTATSHPQLKLTNPKQ